MTGEDMLSDRFAGKVGLQQRVLPAYRVPFFDMLASACEGGLSLFAGDPLPDENIQASTDLLVARYEPGTNHHFLTPGSAFYRCRQEGIIEWLSASEPDVLIVEANPRYPSTPDAIDWMHKRGRPVLGWGLGAPPVSGPFGFWRNRKRVNLIQSLDGIIAYSRRGAKEYQALGYPRERLFVATNAAYARPVGSMPDRSANIDNKPAVLFVGRLQARKRVDNLINACAALPSSLQPGLWIVGDGPSRQDLESLAQVVYPSAEFLGARYGAELDDCFTRADLFVLPGTGGLAVQQAMSFGLPVIVAEGDGTQTDLVRSENGWLIQADDLDAISESLRAALSDVERLRRMGAESYRIVQEEINLEAMVSVFVQALRTISNLIKR